MDCPCFAQIIGNSHCTTVGFVFHTAVEVVAHVQHQAAISQLYYLCFGGIGFGAGANMPGFAAVFAVNNGGMSGVLPAVECFFANVSLKLRRKNQRSIVESNSAPRSLEK